MPTVPRVFISYSHDNADHQRRVLELAQQLRRDGIPAELDQFHDNELLHWPRWCEEQMRPENADFVLCVCTAEYANRVEGRVAADFGKGVFWEGKLIYNELYDAKGNRRCLPLILDGSTAADIPRILQNYTYFQLQQFGLNDTEATNGYRKLYCLLTGQSAIAGEDVGELQTLKSLPEGERKTDFLNLIDQIQRGIIDIHADTQAIRETQAEHGELMRRIQQQAAGYRRGVLHQLPSPPEQFTGRADDLAALLAALRLGNRDNIAPSDVIPCVVISAINGLGGVGKTALAIMAAYALLDEFPAMQLFLAMRTHSPSPRSAEQARDSVLQAVHPEARLPDDEEARWSLYQNLFYAEDGQPLAALVLLDDAADDAQIRRLAPPPPGALLATSRRQLQSGQSLHLDRLAREESVPLLLAYAPRLKPEQADALAKRCGDLPIALRIAGGWLKMYPSKPVAEYLDELQQDRLDGLRGDGPEDDVSRVFAASWQGLSPAERRAFAALSILQSSFSREAGKAVVAAALRPGWWSRLLRRPATKADTPLDRLVHLNLLEYDETTGRFDWHDLLRDYAAQHLPADEKKSARLVHADFFIAVAKLADELYLQGHDALRQGLKLFDQERAQFEAAFGWLSKDTKQDARLINFVDSVVDTSALRFHPRQSIAWFEAQLEAARRLGNRQVEGNALGNLGTAWRELSETRKAIDCYEQRLVKAREIGDRRGEGAVLNNLGLAWADLGETHKAIDYLEQCLLIYRKIGDRRGEGVVLGNLGITRKNLGEVHKAIDYYEQRLVMAREIGDRCGENAALGNLGNAWAILGEPHKAIDYYKQALVIDREIGDRRGEGADLGNLGNVWVALGEAHKAIEYYEQQLTIFREIGDRRGEGNALWNSAVVLVYSRLGVQAEAINRAAAALTIYEAIEDPNAAKVRATLAEWRG
jgi:tetratricopeptide (TPR) repeat protein